MNKVYPDFKLDIHTSSKMEPHHWRMSDVVFDPFIKKWRKKVSNPYDPISVMFEDDEDLEVDFGDDESGDGGEKDLTHLVKEINKIKLEEDEALVVKVPEGTAYEDCEILRQHLIHVFNNEKIIVLVGDVEFTKVEWSKYKGHPLYDE